MKKSDSVMLIPKIELGIVIDHIPAGQGVKILEIISRYEEMKDVPVSLGLNYESKKLGRKDLIKLSLEYLAPEIIQHISVIVPGVTVKAIKNYNVHSRVVVQPPKEMKNLLKCKNPNCITNHEGHIGTFFSAVDEKTTQVKCRYCERIFQTKELTPLFD